MPELRSERGMANLENNLGQIAGHEADAAAGDDRPGG
jgi:hypothetical protein